MELQTGTVDLLARYCTRVAALRLVRAGSVGTATSVVLVCTVAGSLAGAVARFSEESDAGDSCDCTVTGYTDGTYQHSFQIAANIQALPPNGMKRRHLTLLPCELTTWA